MLSTDTITGTPTQSGQTTVTIQVVDSAGSSDSKDLNLIIGDTTSGIVALIQGIPNDVTMKMNPSVTTSRLSPYAPGYQKLLLSFQCQDSNGTLVPDCTVDFDFDVVAGSGGHVHTAARDTGYFISDSGQCFQSGTHVQCDTGVAGTATLTYTAPEASGSTQAKGTVSAKGQTNTFSFTVNVQYDGLAPVASASGLVVETASQNHGNNNGRASGTASTALQNLATQFSQLLHQLGPYPPPPIHVTAISLPLGGLFDLNANWVPPHKAHRFGNDVDVSMNTPVPLTPQQRRILAKAISKAGFATPVAGERPSDPSSNHWHLVIGP